MDDCEFRDGRSGRRILCDVAKCTHPVHRLQHMIGRMRRRAPLQGKQCDGDELQQMLAEGAVHPLNVAHGH